jgi:hypothetical protein
MTDTLQLRALTVAEKRAVAMAARGIPEATITQHTRLTAEQIYAALDRAAQWDRLAWGMPSRTVPSPKAAPAPASEPPAGPTPQQRAVDLYAGGMTVNQVSVATGLTRAEVRTVLGLEADEPRHLLPAMDMPPVLQGVDGSIAGRRPPVIATPKPPAIPARPKPAARPAAPAVPDEVPDVPETAEPAAAPPADDEDLAVSPKVRKWALRAGWQVPPPGTRLPGAVVLSYCTAHGGVC